MTRRITINPNDQKTFPVHAVIPDIKKKLAQVTRLVLQAPTGAGKTTVVPLALLGQSWLQGKHIILLEPRRLAARRAAGRMAELLGERVGGTVGYHIRADKCASRNTKILVVTEGILTRRLQSDPELAQVALVIFDEFHERNLHADVSLAFCLQSQEILREELKILVMSATLDSERIAALLGDAPIIRSQGRCFPVQHVYLAENAVAPEPRRIAAFIQQRMGRILAETTGNLLVFLPGVKEIKQLASSLQTLLREQADAHTFVAPLYGALSKEQQDKAISATPQGTRKIVLATNIAETSLTIEGVSVVVDAGLERISTFSPGSGMNRLDTVVIAQDSADQRCGRAGRVQAGVCYRLWCERQQQRMAKHQAPEILRCDLSQMILELAHWGVREVDELQWLDVPPAGATGQAKTLLQSLQAIDTTGKITDHGRAMLSLGVSPRLAHMMLRAMPLGAAQHACWLAALLTEKDILRATGARSSDLEWRVGLLRQVADQQAVGADVDVQQCRHVLSVAKQFTVRLRRATSDVQQGAVNTALTGVLLALAYPERIAQRRGQERRYRLSSGKGAYLPEHDALLVAPYLAIADVDDRHREVRIYLAASISRAALDTYFAALIATRIEITWQEKAQRVACQRRTTLGRIVLTEQPADVVDQDALHRALLSGVRRLGLRCLPWSKDALALQQRVNCLNAQLSTSPLPNFSDDDLLAQLEHWLQPHLSGQNSIKQLQQLDLFKILLSVLPWAQQKQLDAWAPRHYTAPSGSRIAIDYADANAPTLAVRIQELFGLQDTPTIIDGRCALLIHLLSPAYRPIQVTQDLKQFWASTYFAVKKELKGKYPKHYWPDDPLTAKATNKTKRLM